MSRDLSFGKVPLDYVREFFCRYVVVEPHQADAIALWIAHTYVFETARATPYLHFSSPDWGSGKTTALEVIEVLGANAISIDDISGAALFRLIEERSPTVLLDEVDGVFGKRSSDAAEDHRKLLNSGYRKGKQAIRCGGRNMTELQYFNVFCPKALAGLNELPGTLAHRAIPIAMKPPRPDDTYQDFDPEEVEQEAAMLREHLQAWADQAEADLLDPARKPVKLPELDSRRNEIWRVLFRVADLAGGRWPEAARDAARILSAGDRRADEASAGIKLLGHIRGIFEDERMSCGALVEALNEDEVLPYGGWNNGGGITTRELGHKLSRYEIRAKPVRIDGERAGNGYERVQFEDAWSRYLPDLDFKTGTTGTSHYSSQKPAEIEPVQNASVPVLENAANPHEQRDVPVVPVLGPETGNGAGFDEVQELPAGFTSDEWRRLQLQERELLTELQREFVDHGGGRWLDSDEQ